MFSYMKVKFLVLFAVLLVLVGCDDKKGQLTPVKTVAIKHAQGTTEVPESPKKVVVFNVETLDIMDALNVPVAAVAQTDVHFPEFLSKYSDKTYANVGTLFEPNYEVLSSLQPDIIFAGGRTNDVYKKLSDIAPTVSLNIDQNDFLTSLKQRAEQIGVIFNKQDEAKNLVANFNQKVDQLKPKTSAVGTALVIMVNGGKMSAYGTKSRFGFVFDVLGFQPATTFQEAGHHGNAVTSEFILSVNPEWLFVLDRDNAIGNKEAQSAQQVLDNELIKQTLAWQHEHIVYLDSTSMYIAGGIQTYSHLMDQISNLLQKTSMN